MLCEHAHDYLLDYIDNELPAVLLQELDEHLRGCADCRERFLRGPARWAGVPEARGTA